MAGVVTSLHQCLKYIMNEMLVIVKVKEIVSMIKNTSVLSIKVEDCRDKNIHTFEIMNIEWVSQVTVLRRLKILEVARMTTNCFLKHEIPFQFNPDTKMLEQVNVKKLKCVYKRFELGYKPIKDDYMRVARIKREAIMT